ncbi:MAG TPA: type II toxin-antitoxin system VapC family toxin [Brevundimonas sp.]|uniref:type II toxin-antitoxin system VapC family toxin n=1 Tax=Brevundimonas sp. TaxID=1871086 RepID=UPI002C4517F2|nr:type II toxin-antitoxin system VapC family toxin [Brevundimonas sp.]HRH20974.1 type II toxin-antitoxin system VapC family toxin [Brevundimonas sp.]
MRAIDTNVVVRFLTNDDKSQAKAARLAVEAGDIFIPTTVLLEAEWVLRGAYGFTGAEIVAAMRGLVGLPGVAVENPARLAQALDWMSRGMDFADALHLSSATGCSAFLTFDRRLVKAAAKLVPFAVQAP